MQCTLDLALETHCLHLPSGCFEHYVRAFRLFRNSASHVVAVPAFTVDSLASQCCQYCLVTNGLSFYTWLMLLLASNCISYKSSLSTTHTQNKIVFWALNASNFTQSIRKSLFQIFLCLPTSICVFRSWKNES